MEVPELNIPLDRTYGKIELMLLRLEHDYRHRMSRPDRPYSTLSDTIIGFAVERMPAPEQKPGEKRKRDTREYMAARALKSLLARAQPDLEQFTDDRGEARLRPTATYMRPGGAVSNTDGARRGRKNVSGITELDPLVPRSGYLAARIDGVAAVVAEEQRRLDEGLPFVVVDPWEMHMVLSVIGPRLVGEIMLKVRAAKQLACDVADLV